MLWPNYIYFYSHTYLTINQYLINNLTILRLGNIFDYIRINIIISMTFYVIKRISFFKRDIINYQIDEIIFFWQEIINNQWY